MNREDCLGLDGYCIVIKQCFGSGSFCPDPDRQKNLDLIRKIRIQVRKKTAKTVSKKNYIIFFTFSTILFLSGSSKPNQRTSFTVYTPLIC